MESKRVIDGREKSLIYTLLQLVFFDLFHSLDILSYDETSMKIKSQGRVIAYVNQEMFYLKLAVVFFHLICEFPFSDIVQNMANDLDLRLMNQLRKLKETLQMKGISERQASFFVGYGILNADLVAEMFQKTDEAFLLKIGNIENLKDQRSVYSMFNGVPAA